MDRSRNIGANSSRQADFRAALTQRAQVESLEVKRKVVAPESKAVGKEANLPVYVCEGISGSHQKMEIKKGL